MSLSPVATVLLSATRYAHGRSLHVYEDVVAAAHSLWATLDERDRSALLSLWREQVPPDLARLRDAATSGTWIAVSAREIDAELDAYERLWAWCDRRMGNPSGWPCEACDGDRGDRREDCACRCHPRLPPDVPASVYVLAARLFPRSGKWAATWSEPGGLDLVLPEGGGSRWLAVHPGRLSVGVGNGYKRHFEEPTDADARECVAWLRARLAGTSSPREYMRRRAEDARAVLSALGEET